MQQFEWLKKDGYDLLLICSRQEADAVLGRYHDLPDPSSYSFGDDCFLLASPERRYVSCLPGLEYAFDYEGQAPYINESRESRLDLSRFRLVDFDVVKLPGSIRLLGASVGELCGIRYKYTPCRTLPAQEDLIDEAARCGDETILFAGAAQGLAKAADIPDTQKQIALIRSSLRYFGDLFPHAGYAGDMQQWMMTYNARPLRSDCPSALLQAMPAGWFASSLDEAMRYSDLCVMASCSSPQTRQAARILAGSLFLLRTSRRSLQAREFAGRLLDIPETRQEAAALSSSSMDLAAQALWCVLGAGSFLDAVNRALSLNKEADRLGALSGALAEALYSIPLYLKKRTVARMDPFLARSLAASVDASLENALLH